MNGRKWEEKGNEARQQILAGDPEFIVTPLLAPGYNAGGTVIWREDE